MDVNKINEKLQRLCDKVQSEMRSMAPVRTTFLRRSIILEAKDGQIWFYTPKLCDYAKYQDEGTYGRRKTTKESEKAWGTEPGSRGRAGTGIIPKHFTDPMAQLEPNVIVSEIEQVIIDGIYEDIKKAIEQ